MSTQPSYLTDQFQTFCTTMAHIDFKDVAEAMNAWQGNVKGINFGSLFPIAHRFCQKRQQCFEAIVEKFEQKGYLPFLPGYSAAPYFPELDLDKKRDTFFCARIAMAFITKAVKPSFSSDGYKAKPSRAFENIGCHIMINHESLQVQALSCQAQ